MYAHVDNVAFADVLLSEKGPRGAPHASPGKGGWPTIRYYNKDTGAAGSDYEKQTDLPMCDELGPKGEIYMQKYVEDVAKPVRCVLTEPYQGCGAKETAFHRKASAMPSDQLVDQISQFSSVLKNHDSQLAKFEKAKQEALAQAKRDYVAAMAVADREFRMAKRELDNEVDAQLKAMVDEEIDSLQPEINGFKWVNRQLDILRSIQNANKAKDEL